MRFEQGAFNNKDADKARNVRRVCLILELQRFIQDQNRQSAPESDLDKSEPTENREKEVMTRWLNHSMKVFLHDWNKNQEYWQKPEQVQNKRIKRAEDVTITNNDASGNQQIKTQAPLLENYFNRESATAWGIWSKIFEQFHIKPATEWNAIESYNANLEHIEPKKLRARLLIERTGFVFSHFPKIAFRQYKAAILEKMLFAKDSADNLPSDLRRSLYQEYKNSIKEIACFRSELAVICAEFGDDPTFGQMMSQFWLCFEQQMQGVETMMAEYTNFQTQKVKTPQNKKRHKIHVLSQSLGNPITPEFLPRNNLTEAFREGFKAETVATCLWNEADWSTSPAPKEWDITGKVDGIAHHQNNTTNQSFLSLYQVKGSGRKGIEVIDLEKDNWRDTDLIGGRQTENAESILNQALNFNDSQITDVAPVWMIIGRTGDYKVDNNTGFLLSSPSESKQVGQAVNKLSQLRGA